MAIIYRKAALDKQASPEQLDAMIRIISPSFWLAALGGVIILSVLLIWSILGRLPIDVQTSGIYMSKGGIHTMYSKTAGIVEEIYVDKGDAVTEGQVIARYNTEKAQENIELLTDRKSKVEAVTLTSEGDIATGDNQGLIDTKAQLLTISANLTGSEKMLAMRRKQLAEQQKKTNDAQGKMQLAHNMFYATMNPGTDTKEQLEYQTASSRYSGASTLYESAKTTLVDFKAQNDEKMKQLEREIKELNKAIDEGDTSLEGERDDAKKALAQLKSQESELQAEVDRRSNDLGSAESCFYTTAQAYIYTEELRLAKQTFASQQSDNYNLALNDYNTQLSQLRSLEDAVAQLEVQVSSEGLGVGNQYEALEKQFESAKATALDSLDQQIRKAREQLDDTEIRSTLSGYIVDLNISIGNPVQQGSAVCSISQKNHEVRVNAGAAKTSVKDQFDDTVVYDEDVVICYVPASDGRKIKPGMEVKVYPSTINKEEYGHMKAVVTDVANYVTSEEEMMNQLGNSALVNTFLQKGAVVEVVCELEKDPSTASGYKWSSKKGAVITIDPGTIVATDTVIEEKAPISMIIPYIKEKLDADPNKKKESNT